jgi:hypothetical protein
MPICWEYTVETHAVTDGRYGLLRDGYSAIDFTINGLERELARMGEGGWQLCGVIQTPGPAIFIFKREVVPK